LVILMFLDMSNENVYRLIYGVQNYKLFVIGLAQ
jgi:hypothetical protein